MPAILFSPPSRLNVSPLDSNVIVFTDQNLTFGYRISRQLEDLSNKPDGNKTVGILTMLREGKRTKYRWVTWFGYARRTQDTSKIKGEKIPYSLPGPRLSAIKKPLHESLTVF